MVTVETLIAEARIRAEAASESPCPQRIAVLVDEYLAAQREAARREKERLMRRLARTGGGRRLTLVRDDQPADATGRPGPARDG